MPASPTQRTMQFFHKLEWEIWPAEYWCKFSNKRRDLGGFIDLVLLHEQRKLHVGLQVTTYSNVSARVKKIKTQRRRQARKWIYTGGAVQVWGWKEYPDRAEDGPFKGCRWRPRIVEITGKDLM